MRKISWPKATVVVAVIGAYVALELLGDGQAAAGLTAVIGSIGVATSKWLPSIRKSEEE